MTMTNPGITVNPLTELPFGGGLIRQFDKFLLDLGFTARWAETVEFLMIVGVVFAVLTLAVGKLVPWVSGKLAGHEERLTAPVPAVLLAPEWVITKALVKAGRIPGSFVHGYGESVLVLVDWLQAVLAAVLRLLGSVGKYGRPIAGVLLVLGLLSWNSNSCVGDSLPCVSPVQHWTTQFEGPLVRPVR
ncbi:hypothetical protein OHB12_17510 [Nocardia sp. NBC_01730]|uniref:hypothetical protein n=1 Tax=Nocardia sp. NBC_01730 TaxID=2975998 RepID=UPI002E0F7CD4|nr:hypothetical protein OHB12_17510 [Nocardia sp. NBC_01730]